MGTMPIMKGVPAAIVATYYIVCVASAIQLVVAAPPGPVSAANVGPGAPLADVLGPDEDTKSFVEYVESCQHPNRPGNQLCLAYAEIHGFYRKLVPDSVQPTLLKDSFANFHKSDVDSVCRALGELSDVLKGIAVNGSEAKFYKTVTVSELCSRRCGELHENDQITLRPICKVLAYELQEIKRRTNLPIKETPKAESIAVQSPGANVSPGAISVAAAVSASAPNQQSSGPAAAAAQSNSSKPELVKDEPVSSVTEGKRPVSITPGNNPKLAEDLPPNAPVANQKTSTSTSTIDYSGVIVPNNNEPDENIQLPDDTKQSKQTVAETNVDAGDDKRGSLDGDQGGQFLPEDPEMLNGEDDGDDGDYGGMEEKISPEKSDSEKSKVKSTADEAGRDAGAEKLPKPAHNKKPTQVGDSFEVEGRLEQMNHHNSKMAEINEDPFYDEADSNFFAYFMFLMAICVLGYVAYHNKKKVLALLLEGRRGRGGRGGGSSIGSRRSRRGSSSRKHTAAYQKLDSNLEEAITSTGQSRSSQIIY